MTTRGEQAKRVLVLSFSSLRTDPRVRRQIELLRRNYDVTAVGFDCPDGLSVRCRAIPDRHWPGAIKAVAALQLACGADESAYRLSRCVQGTQAALRDANFDLIVANDIWTLPLALELKGAAKVLFDAHEYSPLEFEESWKWRFFFQRFNEHMCRRYMPRVDAATTVCEGIAQEYRRTTGVNMAIVQNAPPYHELSPRATEPGRVRMIHHGATIASRRLECMIEVMDLLDERFELDLMLIPNESSYFRGLEQAVARRPRVRIVPPVPMTELPRCLNQYDVGLFLLPPANFNYRHALPNKFFEFVQGRLAVAIGPSPEMARLVRQYDCGIIADDFSPRAMADRLHRLDHDRIDHYKRQSHIAARELCFEKSADVLLSTVRKLVGDA